MEGPETPPLAADEPEPRSEPTEPQTEAAPPPAAAPPLIGESAPEPAAAAPAERPAPSVSASSVPPIPRPRPDLSSAQRPLYRECRGLRLRLDPPDLARLRELPGARGKSDEELGEAFFDGHADRLAASLAGDVPAAAEIRVVVDPYSRQAFLAIENRIRGIVSF